MYAKPSLKRRRVATWASWSLAVWVAVCTASYFYVMAGDRIANWLERQAARQMAESQFGERP